MMTDCQFLKTLADSKLKHIKKYVKNFSKGKGYK